jgi:hypothetical protein
VKMRVIQYGDKTFDLDDEYAGPAIAAAISGESGEDVRSEVIDYTDTERGDVDRDEYAIVTGDDGNVLWQGWLDSDKDDAPPPVSRDALADLAAFWEREYVTDGGWEKIFARQLREKIGVKPSPASSSQVRRFAVEDGNR